jgi:hypothetical protein
VNLKKGDLIKHERSLDCALRLWADPVIKEHGTILLEVGWYNLAFRNTFFLGTGGSIEIHPDCLNKWLVLRDPDFQKEPIQTCSKSYRHAKWEYLVEKQKAKNF